ncbi:MAG: phosphonoacetaldehyde hydrolase [Clostridiales bacterium]|nr:phosphonoacetaldehyde hydrolase [Clostridiales bacterium]
MIEAVIFDWAGTTVDYGCFAPVRAFMDSFSHFGVEVTTEETRKPMGMLKRDHIRTMFQMDRISNEWKKINGHAFTKDDVEAVYQQFEKKLFAMLENFASPKPYVLETVEILRNMGIKIGSTTGYTDAMMEIVVSKAAQQGYSPDFWISADSVNGKGRPYPYMIFENLKKFHVSSVKSAIKVGDTVSDIKEGINAGVWTVGVVEGSSLLGLSEKEFCSLSEQKRIELSKKTAREFKDAGADFVIQNIAQLPELVGFLGI